MSRTGIPSNTLSASPTRPSFA
uniref:Uncharacterized protein n=1 Tax=Arundo donax TaxID=35708 RepID=A0A0A8ZFR2_ARUDO